MRSNRFFLSVLQICAVLGLEEAPDDTDLYPPLVEDDVLGCPEGIKCVPKIQCPIHLYFAGYEKPQYCTISPAGKKGYCCPNEIAQERVDEQPVKERQISDFIDDLPVPIIKGTPDKWSTKGLVTEGPGVVVGQPDFVHGFMFQSVPSDNQQSMAGWQAAIDQISKSQQHFQSPSLFTGSVNIVSDRIPTAGNPFQQGPLPPQNGVPLQNVLCPLQVVCPTVPTRYRSFDGSCNNPEPKHGHWGMAGQPMDRLLHPAYEDSIWSPRLHAKDGSLLTEARTISRHLMQDYDRPHHKHNLLLMQFGQFLAHDLTQSSTIRLENGNFVECCSPKRDSVLEPSHRHFACMPLAVEANDDFYSQFNVRCLNFVRLTLAPDGDCRATFGKQRNKVSHFLDASHIYGSTTEISHQLREFNGGRLKMLHDFGRDLLPMTEERGACPSQGPGSACFKSGDGRTNQIVSLTTLHILWAREHNRIASHLAQLNPKFDDEMLFQETRRIVIAELQHIAYTEYLPAVLGQEVYQRFQLQTVTGTDYNSGYSPDVNPAITSEFSGAAFRMGHSTVGGQFIMKQQQFSGVINIPDVMFNPTHMITRSFYDDMLQTLLAQPMQYVDRFISQGLSRFMFKGNNAFGLDLAALNIQRGRDHALRPYNDYVELIGNHIIEDFSQLEPLSGILKQLYRSPDDIDLWVGGLIEKPIHDAIVGPTFAEIIADQFARLKRGDRYFYEYNRETNPGAFTPEQIREIHKVTMARIICDNADHLSLQRVSPSAFVRYDFPGNFPLDCHDPRIPSMDLRAWISIS